MRVPQQCKLSCWFANEWQSLDNHFSRSSRAKYKTTEGAVVLAGVLNERGRSQSRAAQVMSPRVPGSVDKLVPVSR